MSKLLHAIDTAPRIGLMKALERAAAAGQTSTVETILGALTERFPATGKDETNAAVQALNRAVYSRQWDTTAYLASYLADTAKTYLRHRRGGGEKPFRDPVTDHIEQEVLRCLQEHVEKVPPGKPFHLTDAIEDLCVDRGIKFAHTVATIDCAAKRTSEVEQFECVQKAVGGDKYTTFLHINLDLPPEVYGGSGNPCNHFCLANPTWSAETLQNKDDRVVPPGPITVELSDPPALAGRYTIETDGTRASLACALAAKYQELYDNVGTDSGRYLPERDLSELELVEVVHPVTAAPGEQEIFKVHLMPQDISWEK